MRIHHGADSLKFRRHPVMVRNNDPYAQILCQEDLFGIGNTAVYGDDYAFSVFCNPPDGLFIYPIALLQPAGDIR